MKQASLLWYRGRTRSVTLVPEPQEVEDLEMYARQRLKESPFARLSEASTLSGSGTRETHNASRVLNVTAFTISEQGTNR